ncbi:MAG: hypothetical protein JSV52_14505 [Candidatus Zixiibacteriota bacterium]|nr:MAG: hypothetical protein JSV52_14505 [candidate division Zixibacteria bacterium]
MNQNEDLKKIEQKAFRATYQDGLYDICYGIFLLAWAVVPVVRDAGISMFLAALPFLAIPAVLLLAGKKYITAPRLGSARYGKERLSRGTKMFGFGVVSLAITYALIVIVSVWGVRISGFNGPGGMTVPLIESLAIFVGVSVLAYFSEFKRLYIYAVFFAGGIPLAEILYSQVGTPADELIAFGIPAVGIIIVGVVFLVSFLKNNPLPEREVANGI